MSKGMIDIRNTNYEERIVAFIDILGFSELIKNSETNGDLFETVHKALMDIRNINSKLTSARAKEFGRQEALFSDNIVISYLASSSEAEFELLFDAMFIQLYLLYQGILVRGGITTGKLFHNSNMIFGPALVRAYELESKYAIYPRILLDDKYASGSGTMYSVDFDGLTFINSIENFWLCDHLFRKLYKLTDFEYFTEIDSVLKKKINDSTNTGVKSKLLWMENYFSQTFKLSNKTVEFLNSSSTLHRIQKL